MISIFFYNIVEDILCLKLSPLSLFLLSVVFCKVISKIKSTDSMVDIESRLWVIKTLKRILSDYWYKIVIRLEFLEFNEGVLSNSALLVKKIVKSQYLMKLFLHALNCDLLLQSLVLRQSIPSTPSGFLELKQLFYNFYIVMVIFPQEMTGKNATKSTLPDSWKKKSDVVLKNSQRTHF